MGLVSLLIAISIFGSIEAANQSQSNFMNIKFRLLKY